MPFSFTMLELFSSSSRVNVMFPIAELSQRTGVPRKTIRYYDEMGLLPPAKRAENRYRLYTEKDVERLRFIKSARTLGFSLHEIAQILSARDQHEPPCRHVMDLLREHISEIDEQILDLERLRSELTALYEAGQRLPEDKEMRSCVCHLIQVGVSKQHEGEA